jgi:hypothetical protein
MHKFRMSSGMRFFLETCYTRLLELLHPALDTARIITKHFGYFVTTPARTYQQYTV